LLLGGGRGEWATLEIGKSTGCVGLRRVPRSKPLKTGTAPNGRGTAHAPARAHVRDGKRLEPLVELFQRAFSADGVALRAPPENRSPTSRPKPSRAKRTCSFIRLRTPCVRRYLLITTISPRPRRGREVGLRSCLDFYRTIDDTGHIRTSAVREWLGSFSSRRHISTSIGYGSYLVARLRGMSESEQGLRSLVRFQRGELVAGVIMAGDASIRRLSSSPVFHHETLARA